MTDRSLFAVALACTIIMVPLPDLTAQNVGIATNNPQSRLHIFTGNDASLATPSGFLMLGNPAGINLVLDNNEILARNNGATATLNLNIEGGDILLGPLGNGNVGIASSTPLERLHIGEGNVRLDNAPLGINLNAADRPLITRRFDAFTSGNFNGLGRWGLFMELNRLTLGIPNLSGKALEVATYNANSTKNTLLTINNTGEINRPATGGADLAPVCMGVVAKNGTIINGTGNFSVIKGGVGAYIISINNVTLTFNDFVIMVTCKTEDPTSSTDRVAIVGVLVDGKVAIATKNNELAPVFADSGFYFVVYKL